MEKKEIIDNLKANIKFVKEHLKNKHSKEFVSATKGLIEGYEYAIRLLKQK
ncbi:MAG: hypothetical protein WC933_02715 [Candidatus Paceibacterota bacterium]|jgi:quinol monooxygenase YgiN